MGTLEASIERKSANGSQLQFMQNARKSRKFDWRVNLSSTQVLCSSKASINYITQFSYFADPAPVPLTISIYVTKPNPL